MMAEIQSEFVTVIFWHNGIEKEFPLTAKVEELIDYSRKSANRRILFEDYGRAHLLQVVEFVRKTDQKSANTLDEVLSAPCY